MPRYPQLGSLTTDMSSSVFSSLVSRLSTFQGETFPLHVGDTWLDPTPTAQMENLSTERFADLHRYAPPEGYGPLREELLERERKKGLDLEGDQLLITAGATAGLHCGLSAMLDPGDEVLVLAPHWPLIVGIVRACRGVPVTVDVLQHLLGATTMASALIECLDSRRTDRTVALYLSSPNNPTGSVLPRTVVKALVHWAASHDLWVISDEVYEHYAFSVEHTHGAQFDPERTMSCTSFSKSYGLAGARCGYITGPKVLIAEATKVGTHTFYSTPTMGQIAALNALRDGGPWLEAAKTSYYDIGQKTARILGLEPPQGGTFLFLNLKQTIAARSRDKVGSEGLLGLLEACADQGLLLAPGPSFGPYPEMARFCFTCVEPERTLRGAHLLQTLLH